MPDEVKQIWQTQSTESMTMSLDGIRKKAHKFETKIRWRNMREYVAAAIVIAFMSWNFWSAGGHWLLRTAAALCVAGVIYVVVQLHRLGSAPNLSGAMGLTSSLEFHRREMERQRDLLRSVWRWYLGPLVPGLALFIAAGFVLNPGRLQHARLFVGGYAIVVALAFILIARWNGRAAQRLQRCIDELDALGNGR